jgi:hypothetical protein
LVRFPRLLPRFHQREPWGSVAKFDISRYPFSPQHKRELASVVANPDHSLFWKRIAVLDRAPLILDRLRAGANNNPHPRDSKPLSLERIAESLAAISLSKKSDLAKTVKSELQELGITYPKRGRPRNRRAETLYFDYVNALKRAIEHTGVFSRRSQIREQFGAKWEFEFTRLLGREKWPRRCFLWLTTPKATPRALAMNIASEVFDLSYDRIRRACLNTTKSVKK